MHDGHRIRMREKFDKYGEEIFNDHELLELLLFFPISRKNTNELAHKLIERFGSLGGVFDADKNELSEVEGIGATTAFYISLISAAIKRYSLPDYDRRIRLDTYSKVTEYLAELFEDVSEERLYALYLNRDFRMIKCERIERGAREGVDSRIKKIVRCVYKHNAEFLVVAHNHPNGIAIPSAEDIDATLKLAELFRYMDCRLIDHFVLAGNRCTPILNGGEDKYKLTFLSEDAKSHQETGKSKTD